MTNKTTLKGTYCILMDLKSNQSISIGKLGEIEFKKGYYVYVGSALNSLMPRIKRHLSQNKKLHWHIDYLLNHKDVEVVNVLYAVDGNRWECKLALEIARNTTAITDFGCSDCTCGSHLFFSVYYDDLLNYSLNAFKKLKLIPKRYIIQ